ncbi:hypothetical protein [Anaerotruncus rubiinfantis]|uniref:hypothetical protein n=1 Tax=Anaerotruncus rubiinfantis TaxID=1720200 RepID=UPI003D7A5D36
MIKTELMKALERMPDNCEISIEFFDSGYEAWVRKPAKDITIRVWDNAENWKLSIRGMIEG